jgi:hypothetical protein
MPKVCGSMVGGTAPFSQQNRVGRQKQTIHREFM